MDIVEGTATIFKFTDEHYPTPSPPPQPQVPQAAFSQAMVARGGFVPPVGAPPATKKRRLSGSVANQPILLLDDDDDAGPLAPSPMVPSHNRVRARKSTGAPSPQELMKNGAAVSAQSLHAMELQRRLNACLADLERQKQLLVNSQLQHRDQMMKCRQELQRVMHHNQQLQQHGYQQNAVNSQPPPNYEANLQKLQDEVTIAKRQKDKVEEELREIKNQRATEVSGLNLEIEGLRMKLEQQDDTIRKLQRQSQHTSIKLEGDGANGFMSRGSMFQSEYEGTDSI